MSRMEFMKELERLLWDIPEHDRLDAIAYYNSYFDEAGIENEENVLRELGSPEKVAAMIKEDLNTAANPHTPAVRKERKPLPLALVIVLLVFASPVLLGVGGGLLGVIVGLFGALIGLLAGGIGLVVGGAVSLVAGIIKLVVSPVKGLIFIGTGSIVLAIGILLTLLIVWFTFKWFPKVFRTIIDWLQRKIQSLKGGM